MFSKSQKKFRNYPLLSDKNFNETIFRKKEFNLNKTKKIKQIDNIDNINKLLDKLCKFNLSSNQKFLKVYLSSKTPYNSILLFHGTGVGKTCSSISIAENFKEYLLSTNKKVHVLLNPSIQENFKKNIFNIERVKEGFPEKQCTKTRLLVEGNIKNTDNYELINKRIQKIINNRYRFYGYIEFSNVVKKLKQFNDKIFRQKVKEIFSGTVMIIDEVHNIKENNNKKDNKLLPEYLKEILSISENMTLILLSATPMSDKANEILFLLNLLLINDKREPIKEKKLFNKEGYITPLGRKIITEKSTGYVSYLRGEHPIKFPKRLYPDVYDNKDIIKKFPEIDINNKPISKGEQINKLKIIGCSLDKYQLEKYSLMDMKGNDDDYGSFNINGLMASNIVYPEVKKSSNIKYLLGDSGLGNIVKKVKKKYTFLDDSYRDFFLKKNIKKYSSKIHKILQNIEGKQGIIFIYSRFLGSGIIPLALALEMNGYSNFNGSLIEKTKDDKKKYLLITGDNELSKNSYSNYLKVENKNKYGDKVKIIIGSETAAEGLDFKYIREVHVMEPWFHFNKIEQVIGRAIRNCSHKDLLFEERNVLVYLYATVFGNKKETIDLKMYRLSEKKMNQIAEVEYMLKVSSVDCNLNIEGNRFIDKIYKKKHEMILSNGTKRMLSLEDKDNSKICNFENCDYKCIPDITGKKDIDMSTLNFENIEDNIYDIKQIVKDLFTQHFYYELKDIVKEFLNEYEKDDLELLYYSINDLIKARDELKDPYGNLSVLKKRGKGYIVAPIYLSNQFISLNNLRKPLTKKKEFLNVTDSYLNSINKTKKGNILSSKFFRDIGNKNKHIEKLINDKNFTSKEKITLTQLQERLNKIPNKDNAYNYLDVDKKEELLKILIKNKNKKNLDDLEKQMLFNLDSNILFIRRDLDMMYKNKDDIYGYKIIDGEDNVRYIKYDSKKDTFIKPPSDDLKLIIKNIMRNIKNELPPNNFIGYLVNKKGNNIELKIREKNESKKLTEIKTGSICGNEGMKKDKIIYYIRNVYNKMKYLGERSLPGKKNLCNELEMYLRLRELENQNSKRWYYTSEEAVERGLNKKKN